MSHDLHELTNRLQQLDDRLVACMKCGMCQAVCPVFAETLQEGDVTRGKITLLQNLAGKIIRDAKGVQEKLNKCLLCGTCQVNCPSGVNIMDIFFEARIIVNTYMGLSAIKKVILRGMLTRPKLFNMLLDIGSRFQGLIVTGKDETTGSSCSRFLTPVIGDRYFMPLAKNPLHREIPCLDTPAGKSGIKVAFYPGCLIDKMFPHIAKDIFKILAYHEVGVFMPKGQACCGIPALSSGAKDAYDKLVALNINAFSGHEFDYLLTACASCTSTIKELWPKMAPNYPRDLREQIESLAEKTLDVHEFIIDKLGVKPNNAAREQQVKVTYHEPCHLGKSLGIKSQPRDIIRLNPAYDFQEMAAADRCCGCGGSFNLQHYNLSAKIGEHKRENIVRSGAKIAATSCPACMMQLADMLAKKHDDIQVRHSIELYAEMLPARP